MADSDKAVFLSYASQDAAAVRGIAEALRAAGVEVWFDQNELVGGDAWDAKIRGQIAACALFVPIISASTQARHEGYFRLEWKLAAQRTHMMSGARAFLLPVVIDETRDAEAHVPAEFKAVQWTRLRQAYGGQARAPHNNEQARDEALEKFCARVRRVLEGAVEGAAVLAALPAAVSRTKPRLPLRWIGLVAAVLALGGAGWWLTAKRPAHAPMTNSTAAEPGGDVPRLVERARELRVLNDLTRERLGAAEELLKQAAKLSPTDPDVLAVQAQVDVLMSYRSWDRSEERRQAAGQRAARAVALAPDGFESRRAQAMVAAFMLQSPEALQEAEAMYRRLTGERPGDANVIEELGTILLWQGKPHEAARIFTQAGQRLLAAKAQMWAGQARQARDGAVALLAERRSVGALVLKANVDLFGFNDREAARASVSQLTPTELREDDAAGIALRLAVLSADAPGLLKLMEQFPHPFVSILGINYPRRYWTGMAREWLKQPDAARIEWRAALQTIEERLKANPADSDALSWAALLHMCLGDVAATEQALRAYRNYRDLSTGYWDFHYCLPLLRVAGGEDEAIDRLAKTLREPPNGQFNTMVYAWARFSPEFDPLRGKPRFEQLLREVRPAEALPFADERAGAAAAAPEKSVAVLAFANLSDDKANEVFSDGISEELRNLLSEIPGLKVMARASAFSFKGRNVAIPEIARQLGVAHVVDGSVRRSGNQVRITVQLLKAADGFQVWSDTFRRELQDIFAVQDEIARLVAGALQLRLGPDAGHALTRGSTQNPAAYETFLKGRQAYNASSADQRIAVGHLQTAVQLDPRFALAHGALAEAYVAQANVGAEPAGKMFPLARAAAEQALALDRRIVQAYTALAECAFHFEWDYEKSDEFLRQALAVDPNYAGAHGRMAGHNNARGRFEEALAGQRRVKELDPFDQAANDAWTLAAMQRYPDAIAAAREHLARFPEATFTRATLGFALYEDGKPADAIRVFEELAAKLPDDPLALSALAWGLGRSGQTARARALLERMSVLAASRHISPLFPAYAASGMGDRDLAFAHLERAFEVRDPHLPDIGVGPLFAPIRSDPRFRAMLQRLKLDRYFPEGPKK